MHSKIKNIFIFSIIILGTLIILLFSGSIFLQFYSKKNVSIQKDSQTLDYFNFKVKIYNAANAEGIARHTQNFLRNFDIKVEGVQNYPTQEELSKIVVSKTTFQFGQFVGKILGIDENNLEFQDSLGNFCYIILGKDYKLLKPFRN